MNLQKCKNGHYYDQDKFVKCPYCAAKKMPLRDTLVLDGAEDAHTRTEESPHEGIQGREYAQEMNPQTSVSLKDAVAYAMQQRQQQEWKLCATDSVTASVLSATGGSADRNESLPVGIFVAIEGKCKGKLYALVSGDNYLYQEHGTTYVQSESGGEVQSQAAVCYDAESNLFVLKLLDRSSDIRIGKMRLEENVRLVPYDTILIGEDILLFVPICGDQFRW